MFIRGSGLLWYFPWRPKPIGEVPGVETHGVPRERVIMIRDKSKRDKAWLDVRDHINMLMGLSMHGLALIGSL